MELARAVDFSKQGQINYLEFLGLFTQEASLADLQKDGRLGLSLVEHVCLTLWSNDVVYHKAMKVHDPDALGCLCPDEFLSALLAMNSALGEPLAEQQLSQLAHGLPTDDDGRISYDQFLSSFRVHDVLFSETRAERKTRASRASMRASVSGSGDVTA